jgi:photosystem II stability/assembly factor-like uncharacterized protein
MRGRSRLSVAERFIFSIGILVVALCAISSHHATVRAAVAAPLRLAADDAPVPPGSQTSLGFLPSDPRQPVPPENGGEVPPAGAGRGYLVWDGRGPWGGNVKSIIADPADASRILCATGLSSAREAGGVWISTDGGTNWGDSSLQGFPCSMVAASLAEPGVFYAAAYDGLYRSTDSGANWARIAFTAQIIGVGVKADDGNVIIAGLSSNAGIKRSTDRGATWQTVGINTYYMKGFAVSPAAPNRMYLAMSAAPSACYRSDDGGATWVSTGPNSTDGWGLWVNPADADQVIVSTSNGVYKSTNGGTTWTLMIAGTCYANVSVKDGVIYAPMVSGPSGGSVYESADGGTTWVNCPDGIVPSFFYASGATATGVLAGHYGGLYHTPAFDSDWVVSQTGMNNAYVRTISYYADRHELWAGTDQSGLWRSTNDGQTWELKSAGLTDWATYRLTPKDHEHVQGDRMFITTYTGVFRSTDHGETWQPVGFSGQFMRGILIDPGHPDRIWTGGAIDQSIWRSEDAGGTWQPVGTGITGGLYPDFNMGRSPSNGPRLLVNYEQLTNRIYYSDDLGATFTAATGLETTAYQPSLTLHDANPAIVFCGTDIGVYKSTNYGASFSASGLSSVVWSLLGTRTPDVYAGRNRTGVYVSHDDGGTWVALNAGIETQVMWDLCYGSTTSTLFSSPRGRGVKVLSLEPASDAGEHSSGSSGTAVVTAPNPFRDRAVISFTRPLSGDVQIRVTDPAGRLVRSERFDAAAMMRSWAWDGLDAAGRPLPSGTYFYDVQSGSAHVTGRSVLMR